MTFATGTPIFNSMTELYTNMRYLQYHTLQKLGLGQFDSWASSFGETQTAIEKAFQIWDQTKEEKSAQMIFCDLSTPKGNGIFSVYEDIKSKLIEKGVPAKEIEFIHDANTEAKKTELFGKVIVKL